jgi:hypothetical protein
MVNEQPAAVRILGELSDLLARYGYEGPSGFVAGVIDDTDPETFWSTASGLGLWGGSGAVWEVEPFQYSHPDSDSSAEDYRRFQILMIQLSDILETKGVAGLSARNADLFRRELAQETWIADPELDLFSEQNRSKVEDALSKPDAVVFGWHYHYAGGASRTDVVFTDYLDYLERTDWARPGDHFTLVDLDSAALLALARVGSPGSPDSPMLTSAQWEDLGQRVRNGKEVVVVRRYVALSGAVEVELSHDTYPEDEWLTAFKRELQAGRGELLIWDNEVFDESPTGSTSTVTPGPGSRRVHALVDAKRPSSNGTVPRSGPY